MLKLTLLAGIVLAGAAAAQIQTSPFSSTFSGASATRGFFFQTPVAIVVVGLRVPDETKNGLQNVEVFKMAAPPPAFPATGTGTSVFYSVGQPSKDIIPCALVFQAGDYVGVLGACGTATMLNSYGTGNYATNVLGQPITLMRMLTQTNLVTSGGNQW